MALPFVFASLNAADVSDLDANFAALGLLTTIPCTVSGTNTLTLAPLAGTPTVTGYQNYAIYSGVATNANTSATVANVAGFGNTNVYKDTGSGPVALTGGEIQAGNLIVLVYDKALNTGTGGFHLQTAPATLTGTVTRIVAGAGLSGGTITTSGTISTATVPNLRLMGNISGGNAPPSASTLTQMFDSMMNTVQYGYAQRGASAWAVVGGVGNGLSAAGSNQGTATQLAAQFNELTTVGSGQGVILATTIGLPQTIFNEGGSTVLVYPPSGAQIDALGTNAATSIVATHKGTYVMMSASQGYTVTP